MHETDLTYVTRIDSTLWPLRRIRFEFQYLSEFEVKFEASENGTGDQAGYSDEKTKIQKSREFVPLTKKPRFGAVRLKLPQNRG